MTNLMQATPDTIHRITIIQNRKLNRIKFEWHGRQQKQQQQQKKNAELSPAQLLLIFLLCISPNTMFNIVIYFVITLINSCQLFVCVCDGAFAPYIFLLKFVLRLSVRRVSASLCAFYEESMMSIHIITVGLFSLHMRLQTLTETQSLCAFDLAKRSSYSRLRSVAYFIRNKTQSNRNIR